MDAVWTAGLEPGLVRARIVSWEAEPGPTHTGLLTGRAGASDMVG